MQYPAHAQGLDHQCASQHLRPQAQLAGPHSSYGPMRYIQVGNNDMSAQQSSAGHMQIGDVQQSTDGGEDWVEQVTNVTTCKWC